MNISKTCPYCERRGYINQFENIDSGCRAWAKECIACKGTGSILYPETNADRIRAMSDEELAKLLCVQGWKLEEMTECLAWLKAPAEEDT